MSDWKQLFAFTKQERNGIAVLCTLIVGAIAYIALQPVLFQPATIPTEIPTAYRTNVTEDVAPAESGSNGTTTETKYDQPDLASIAGQSSVYQQNELFLFNPNGLAETEWVRLGLTPAQAKSVKNFEAKGGVFRTKEDVKKLYVISPEKYSELEPYIVIPQGADSTRTYEKKKSTVILELNTADTSQLVQVSGIGPAFAARIVAYRARLGGFHHKEQLKEVYGIDEEKYTQIQGSFKCDSTYITKINVNTAEVSQLKLHPYFTPTVANALVNYRKQHGNFKQVSDIMQCKVITRELFLKLAPYLTI